MKSVFQCVMLTVVATVSTLVSFAQSTENSRGVYRLQYVVGSDSVVKKPSFEQYKICTDSISLMVTLTVKNQNISYHMGKNDDMLNYTGEALDAADSTKTRVFNSNAEAFTLRWWNKSTFTSALFTPRSWIDEYYKADDIPANVQPLFDALMQPVSSYNSKTPLYGLWRSVGLFDELKDIQKTEIKSLEQDASADAATKNLMLVTSSCVLETGSQLYIPVRSDGKKAFTYLDKGTTFKVHWLGKNVIAVETKRQQFTDYTLWQRVNGTESPFSHIAKFFISRPVVNINSLF